MEKHYQHWAALYPLRGASSESSENAAVEYQLKQLVANMADDLNGVFSFLELMGFRLDDH